MISHRPLVLQSTNDTSTDCLVNRRSLPARSIDPSQPPTLPWAAALIPPLCRTLAPSDWNARDPTILAPIGPSLDLRRIGERTRNRHRQVDFRGGTQDHHGSHSFFYPHWRYNHLLGRSYRDPTLHTSAVSNFDSPANLRFAICGSYSTGLCMLRSDDTIHLEIPSRQGAVTTISGRTDYSSPFSSAHAPHTAVSGSRCCCRLSLGMGGGKSYEQKFSACWNGYIHIVGHNVGRMGNLHPGRCSLLHQYHLGT